MRGDHLAMQVPAAEWSAWAIKEGAKGPLLAEFAFLRAVAVRDDLPGPDIWVVLRRRLDSSAETQRSSVERACRHAPGDAWSGSPGCAGRLSRLLRSARASWGWTTTRCAAGSAGTTTPR